MSGDEYRRKSDRDIEEIKLLLAGLKPTIDNMNALVERHNNFIYGNNGSAGADKRIDRLEVSKKNHDKHAYAAWGGFLAAAGKWVFDLVTSHNG